MKPLLVGECNPYQTDPRMADRYALHPDPPQASGGRLCHFVMGLDEDTYLRAFDRVDLCFPKWIMKAARVKAAQLLVARKWTDVMVLCGAKVAAAFGLPSTPFQIYGGDLWGLPRRVVLPHPSGLCRVWGEAGAVERARRVLHEAGVLPPRQFEVDRDGRELAPGHLVRCEYVPPGRWMCIVGCPTAAQELEEMRR